MKLLFDSFLSRLLGWAAVVGTVVVPPSLHAQDALQVEPSKVTLHGPFARAQLLVRPAQASADPAAQPDWTHMAGYRSSRPDVAGVDAAGQVLARGDGDAEITITVNGTARSIPVHISGVGTTPQVGFEEQIIPIISKAGCNAGACHASQYGQGGFKLSVFASDPVADHQAIARDNLGRRISVTQPAESLLLLKPTGAVAHGGGVRLEVGSVDHQTLSAWIGAGATASTSKTAPKVTGLEVSPSRRLDSKDFTQQLRVVASFDDGNRRDVTHWARFESMNEGMLQVDPHGRVQVRGRGQGTVMIRFAGQTTIMQVIVPYGPSPDLAGWKENNFIDKLAATKFRELGLAPAALCDDAAFLRRAYLHATGTVPTVEEARLFLDSSDPDKRRKLVDRLLGLTGDPRQDLHNENYAAWWSLQWADLLRNHGGGHEMWALHNWLQAAFRENKRFDSFVRDFIMARGSVVSNGPANFYRIFANADDRTEAVSQIFLGVRLQCAKCHHHPFEPISQAEFYGMAAFFGRVGTKALQDFGVRHYNTEVVVLNKGEVRHPRDNRILPPTPLRGRPITALEKGDRRQGLADWITASDNPYFARNIVNRYWAMLMGRGLVEPVDDMRGTNPPSNPELLDALAREFVRTGYDAKQLLRTIMTSHLYQLDSSANRSADVEGRYYASFRAKRIAAEPLSDAIDLATGTVSHFKGVPGGTRAIELPDSMYNDGLLGTFGKPKRESICECERIAEPSLAQALHVLNSETLHAKITNPKGRIARLVTDKKPHDAVVEELFLAALSRRPTAAEQDACRRLAAQAADAKSFYEDMLWSLFNSKQFLFVR